MRNRSSGRSLALATEAGEAGGRDAAAHLLLLRRHLRTAAASGPPPGADASAWLRAVAAGDLGAVPEGLAWRDAAPLAHLVDGYRLAAEAGLGEPMAFLERKWEEARRTGLWSGSALALWACLFLACRRERFAGIETGHDATALLDALCTALRARLVGLAEG